VSREEFRKLIEEKNLSPDDAEVLDIEGGDRVFIKVGTFEGAQEIIDNGVWCIVSDESYFNDYLYGLEREQCFKGCHVVIKDPSLGVYDNLSEIGITISLTGEIIAAFDKKNDNIIDRLDDILGEELINEIISTSIEDPRTDYLLFKEAYRNIDCDFDGDSPISELEEYANHPLLLFNEMIGDDMIERQLFVSTKLIEKTLDDHNKYYIHPSDDILKSIKGAMIFLRVKEESFDEDLILEGLEFRGIDVYEFDEDPDINYFKEEHPDEYEEVYQEVIGKMQDLKWDGIIKLEGVEGLTDLYRMCSKEAREDFYDYFSTNLIKKALIEKNISSNRLSSLRGYDKVKTIDMHRESLLTAMMEDNYEKILPELDIDLSKIVINSVVQRSKEPPKVLIKELIKNIEDDEGATLYSGLPNYLIKVRNVEARKEIANKLSDDVLSRRISVETLINMSCDARLIDIFDDSQKKVIGKTVKKCLDLGTIGDFPSSLDVGDKKLSGLDKKFRKLYDKGIVDVDDIDKIRRLPSIPIVGAKDLSNLVKDIESNSKLKSDVGIIIKNQEYKRKDSVSKGID